MIINLEVSFNNKHYKGLLKKLQTLLRYTVTVGIHQKEGTQKVYHRYSSGKINKKTGNYIMHTSGKSHRMTIAKLAYQNEFGATITIKPRYKTYTRKSKKGLEKYRDFRKASEQGYLLRDKMGNFVAYFKPNTNITIPSRSFIRKIAREHDPNLESKIQSVMGNTLVRGGFTAKTGITKIAKLIEYKMKNNIPNTKPNHPLTFKAKGHKTPLIDEKDRLRKSIKYKIYKDVQTEGTKGYYSFVNQTIKHIDHLLKSADEYNDKL